MPLKLCQRPSQFIYVPDVSAKVPIGKMRSADSSKFEVKYGENATVNESSFFVIG